MHYWHLLLLAFLATLGSIAQADRFLVHGERRIHEQERFCGKEARSLARDTRSTLDGARNEPSIQRERFEARTDTSRANSQRNAANRQILDRDHKHLTNIRSAEDRFIKNQITRERSDERAREWRSVRDITRRESREQRFSRDVRQYSHEHGVHRPIPIRSERYLTKENQRLSESRRTREINGQRENDIKRTTLAQQSRRERISFDTTRRERENINERRGREFNSRQSYRVTNKVSRFEKVNGLFTNSRGRSSEISRRERDNINSQRDREINIRQSYRAPDGTDSRSQQNEKRIFSNSRGRSFERTRIERENLREQRDHEANSRQSFRDTARTASRAQQNDNRIEKRENGKKDSVYDNRRIRELNRSTIRRVRNFDGERGNSLFTREGRNSVRVQSNDRRHSDAHVRQEPLIRTSERDSERNTETRRVRSTERADFRQIDRRMATGLISERVKFGNRHHLVQKNDIQSMSSLTYLIYTLQGLYICSVLFHLAGIFKNEKKNCGFLHFLTHSPHSIGKEIKVD